MNNRAHTSQLPSQNITASSEWRRGWTTVALGFLSCATSMAGFISLGTLSRPVQTEMDWTRYEIAITALILGVSALVFSPVVGRLVERYGIRRVASAGVIGFAAGQTSVALVSSAIESWWTAWLFAFVGAQFIGPAAWATSVAPLFRRNRGLALGITMAGIGLANLVVPPIAAWIDMRWGWRQFYLVLGFWSMAFVLPALLLALPKHRTEDVASNTPGAEQSGLSVKQALAGTLLWRQILAVTLFSATIGFLVLNIQELLRDKGYTMMAAAAISAGYGPAQLVGRVGAGLLLDRVRGDWLTAAIFLLPALGCYLLLSVDSGPLLFLAPAFAGVAAGVEIDAIAYLASRYFGLRRYGTIYGILFGAYSIAVGIGPVAGAFMREAYGSYELALWVAIAALGVSSAIMMTLGRYRY